MTQEPRYIDRETARTILITKCAPLQDKNGVPMGGVYNENVGPGRELREARIRHGRNPFGG